MNKQHTAQDVETELRQYIRMKLLHKQNAPVTADDLLFSPSVGLDAVDVCYLLFYIEEHYKVQFSEKVFSDQKTYSLSSLVELIVKGMETPSPCR